MENYTQKNASIRLQYLVKNENGENDKKSRVFSRIRPDITFSSLETFKENVQKLTSYNIIQSRITVTKEF